MAPEPTGEHPGKPGSTASRSQRMSARAGVLPNLLHRVDAGRSRGWMSRRKSPGVQRGMQRAGVVVKVVGQAFEPAGGEAFQLRIEEPVRMLRGPGDWKVPGTGRQECLPYLSRAGRGCEEGAWWDGEARCIRWVSDGHPMGIRWVSDGYPMGMRQVQGADLGRGRRVGGDAVAAVGRKTASIRWGESCQPLR